MDQRTYRVIVRGRFSGLDEAARTRLREQAAEHDLLTARFTDAGTLSSSATCLDDVKVRRR